MIHLDGSTIGLVAGLAIVGIVAGLSLLARGFGGYRTAGRVSGTSPSRIASLAVGEVLVSGTAEPIELTLVSPLQSQPCVYYAARVTESGDGDGRDVLSEERAVGFRVRDPSGAIRVFPAGARFDVPDRFDERSPALGGDPVGLLPRDGSPFAPSATDREAQIAALLTVHQLRRPPVVGDVTGFGWRLPGSSARRHYREARIEPGETVTILGRAMPFGEVEDPAAANILDGSAVAADDPEIAADLAAARAAGLLEATPQAAWGNAAIEGFGIGRPVREPHLDPAANRAPPPDPELAARAAAAFEIAPETPVIVASDDVPLVISLGAPSAVAARQQWQFVVGLAGAAVAIGSAMALALAINGGLR